MIEPKKEQDESIVQCPVCSGHGELRGAETKIAWFNCGYCNGTGKVTQKRFHAWQDRSTESPAADAANTAEPLADRIQTEAENS
jgi:DnaJ-class molecular chaperone